MRLALLRRLSRLDTERGYLWQEEGWHLGTFHKRFEVGFDSHFCYYEKINTTYYYMLYFSKPKEPLSLAVETADAKGIDVGVYRY